MFTIHFDKPLKKIVHFLHKHHASFCIHSFKSESHTLFFSIKGQSVSKVVWRPHSKPTRTYNTRANKKKEHISLNKKSTSIREEVNNTPGRVKETEYPGGFIGSFAESASIPARALTPTSTTASITGSKDAVWPNPIDICGAASHPAPGEPCPDQGASSGTSKIASMMV